MCFPVLPLWQKLLKNKPTYSWINTNSQRSFKYLHTSFVCLNKTTAFVTSALMSFDIQLFGLKFIEHQKHIIY